MQDRLDTNSDLSDSMPIPESEEIQDGDKQIIDDDEYPELEKHDIEEPAAKPSLGDRIVKRLKGIICAVAGAFQVVKRKLPWPFSKIPYTTIATKVANVIDKVSIVIKVITGKLKMTTARDEMKNADTALLGTTIEKKMPGKVSVTELVRHTFGKAGACIKHLVQKTIATVFPKFRQAIKTGFQKITGAIKGFWERLTGRGKITNPTTITETQVVMTGR
ncbi:hypothetical protein FACS1894142_8690 [Spirochaetia bacterium]|nr:hypothetical protein FACS1894142_8690 [Spirochaetia bacterium]